MKRILLLILAYMAWVIVYLLFHIRGLKRQIKNRQECTPNSPDSIVKRCSYLHQITPNDLKQNQSESAEKKDFMFVPETEKQRPTQVSTEDLDKTFSNTQAEIPEDEIEVEYPPLSQIEIEEELEFLGGVDAQRAEFASGSLFDDIDSAVKTVSKENPPYEEQIKAGQTFNEIENTELCEQLINSSQLIAKRVTELIAMALDVDKKILTQPATMTNFDIHDFV